MTQMRAAPPRDDLYRALRPGVEFRAVGDDAATLFGHFAVFDRWTEIDSWFEGNFLERIAPGAFKKTFRENRGQIRVIFQHGHDPDLGDKPIGKPEVLREDETGAYYEAPLFDGIPPLVMAGLRAGEYGSSFRFRVMKDEFVEEPGASDENPKGLPERTIKEVRLWEFGPVTWGAYPEADSGVRSLTDDFLLARADPERLRALLDARANDPSGILVPSELSGTRYGTVPESERDSALPDALPAQEPDAESTPEPESRADGEAAAERPPTNEETKENDVQFKHGTPDEMRARQDEIKSRMKEIDSEWAGQALPDESQREYDSLDREHDELERHITAYEARQRRIAELDGNERREDRGWTPQVSRPNSSTRGDVYDLSDVRVGIHDRDGLKRELDDRAKVAIERSVFDHPSANREDVQGYLEKLLEKVDDPKSPGALARHLLLTGGPTYRRAFGKAILSQPLSEVEMRALSLTGAEGGFAVPFQLDPTIIPTSNSSVNPIRAIARVEQIVVDQWKGVSSAGITASRSAEAAEAADNAPTLAQPAVDAERVSVFVPFSWEVGQDWNGLLSEMSTLIQDAKDDEEASSFFTGNGTTPNPQGVVTGTTNTVNASAGQTYTLANLYALQEGLPPRFRPRGSFVANLAIHNRTRQFDTAGGAGLWVRLPDGTGNELLGRPVYEASAMASSPATGNKFLLFGDFRYYIIVDRIGMQVSILQHLLGANRRPTGQSGLYAFWRNNGKVLDAAAFRSLLGVA